MKIPIKYHFKNGTHCWFCDRDYETSVALTTHAGNPLLKTKEHIIPVSRGGKNSIANYVSSCFDCNNLKSNRDAKLFAIYLSRLIPSEINHPMYYLFKKMMQRSWKIYNKTSKLHKQFSTYENVKAEKKIRRLLRQRDWKVISYYYEPVRSPKIGREGGYDVVIDVEGYHEFFKLGLETKADILCECDKGFLRAFNLKDMIYMINLLPNKNTLIYEDESNFQMV